MNKQLKTGLLLQIPNAIILTVLAIVWIIPYLSLSLVVWAILGSVYFLLNIASAILIIVGILSPNK